MQPSLSVRTECETYGCEVVVLSSFCGISIDIEAALADRLQYFDSDIGQVMSCHAFDFSLLLTQRLSRHALVAGIYPCPLRY